MKKVIFLDFDGVMRPFAYTEVCEQLWKANPQCKTKDIFGYYFAPYAVDTLTYILAMSGASIVISSSWRKSGLSEMKELWRSRRLPFPERIVGITPITQNTNRGHEISAYLNETSAIKSYLILDDKNDMGEVHKNHFLQINSKFGLTIDLASKCIDILNIKKINEALLKP